MNTDCWRRIVTTLAMSSVGASFTLASLAGCGKSDKMPRATRAAAPQSANRRSGVRCPTGVRPRTVRQIKVGAGADALAINGSEVWVTRPRAGTITRISGRRHEVVDVGPTPVTAVFAFGKLWIGLRDGNRIVSVDPHTLVETQGPSISVPVKLLAAGPTLWALSLDSNALFPIEPTSNEVGEPIYAPVADAIDMVLAGDELWVLGASNGGLSPVNVSLRRVVRSGFDLPGRLVGGLSAAGTELWLAEPTRNALLRIDGSTINVTEFPMSSSVRPSSTAVGPCGVWVASGDGMLTIVSSETGRALATPIRVGRSVGELVASGTGVWVSDPVDGKIVYVAPG